MKLISNSFRALANQLEDGRKKSSLMAAIPDQELKKLKAQLSRGELIVPDDMLQEVVRSTVERDFLSEVPSETKFPPQVLFKEKGWMRIDRLPLSPLEDKSHALFPKWQNAIAAMHTLKLRLCYVLLRREGETALYLGAIPMDQKKKSTEAQNQLLESMTSQMPGIGLQPTRPEEILSGLYGLSCCGAVTGLPSTRKITEYGEYQTMDQLVKGLRDIHVNEQDFALVVVADPVQDTQIRQIQSTLEKLSTEIYSIAQYTRSDSVNTTDNANLSSTDGLNAGLNVSGGAHFGLGIGGDKSDSKSDSKLWNLGANLNNLLRAHFDINMNTGANLGRFLSNTYSRGVAVGNSNSLSQQYVNKSAMDCKELLDKHIERTKAGRGMGFWKTGVYVLAESQINVETIMGLLRAAYSGDDTHMEPIRTTIMGEDSGADTIVRQFHHLPYPSGSVATALGHVFEDYATPMTTQELSIAISLPTSVNPPESSNSKSILLGEVQDTGVSTNQDYNICVNELPKHTLIVGSSGGGKTTTSKRILEELQKNEVPFLVVEPAKEEFMSWAIRQNKRTDRKKILIFAPGRIGIENLRELKLNPFQPAAAKGGIIDMSKHLSLITSAFLSTMPMENDIIPILIRRTLTLHVRDHLYIPKLLNGSSSHSPTDGPYQDNGKIQYPSLHGLVSTAKKSLEGLYATDSHTNLTSALTTRIENLTQDWKKNQILLVPRSIDFEELLENDVVINLSSLDEEDKAFIMSLILIGLWEWRESKYKTDAAYRAAADRGELQHLTLVDEAHTLMPRFGTNTQMHAARTFSGMLKEVRAYGEGLIISDQVPTDLIPDAVKNTNLKVIHRLNTSDDIELISAGMRLRPDQAAVIGALQPGEAIVCGNYDDAAAWVKVYPSEEKRQ